MNRNRETADKEQIEQVSEAEADPGEAETRQAARKYQGLPGKYLL